MGITAIPWMRQRLYRVFASLHWLWIPAFALAIIHIPKCMHPTIVPVTLLILDRLVFTSGCTGGKVAGGSPVVATGVRVSDDVLALLIPVGSSSSRESLSKKAIDEELSKLYTPGRFVSITIPQISLISHPFSIASYSLENHTVVILIRALGGWTQELLNRCTPEGTAISLRLAGPYSSPALGVISSNAGSGKLQEGGHAKQRTIIAGGVGLSKYLMGPNPKVTRAPLPQIMDPMDESKPALTSKEEKNKGEIHNGSFEGPERRVWLCKDPKEYQAYLYFGGNLAGWEIFGKSLSKLNLSEPGSFPPSFPLFEQRLVCVFLVLSSSFLIHINFYCFHWSFDFIQLTPNLNAIICRCHL
jgi:hypothetical protein